MTTIDELIPHYQVVHPMFDEPEAKLSPVGMGQIKMSKSVKVSLLLLRAYLMLMFGLLAYHMLDLAGTFGPHIAR